MRTWTQIFFGIALLVFISNSNQVLAQGSIVWNGPVITFTNLPGSDWTQAANQDHLTANVWLTRKITKGLFNAASEGGYAHSVSPADTEWALGLLVNSASLTYTDWETAYGGQFVLAGNIVGQNAVLHLITDDIYLGIKFTAWGGSSGGFTYERTTATAVPEPAPAILGIVGAAMLLGVSARRTLRGKK
jgi:hypothetical protein